jgi:predicted PurR-regulated permease PerM
VTGKWECSPGYEAKELKATVEPIHPTTGAHTMTSATNTRELPRITLLVLSIVGLITASFWVLHEFLLAAVWATMIVVATWPLMLRIQATLWGRRSLAVTVMTIALLLVFVIPFSLAIGTIVINAHEIVVWAESLSEVKLPPPPDWIQALPVVGPRAASAWQEFSSSGPKELIRPHIQDAAVWLVERMAGLGVMTVHFLLTVAIAAILYARGEIATTGVCSFCRRLAGEQGDHVVYLAGQAIRGVALGVILTAIIAAALSEIGLAAAGVPFAAILSAIIFLLCVVQLGPTLVLACAIAWLYWKGHSGWGTALLLWSIVVVGVDHVLKPVLIKKGAQLPLLLVFAGVLGGLTAFGLVGIFVGPVILAVAYKVTEAWVREEAAEGAAPNK